MKEIIDLIIKYKQIVLTILSPFFGAFFAFCFFIVSERWRSKRERKNEWRKTYLNEHAYLDRYLQRLIVILSSNIKFQIIINEQYKQRQLALRDLQVFPIREDSSMKLDDLDYLNKIEQLITDLKRLNSDIEIFNNFKNRMNDNVEKFILEQKREDIKEKIEEAISMFLEESKIIINFQKMLKDDLVNLVAENMFLYSFYKKRFIKKFIIKIKMRICDKYRKSEIEKEKNKILEQVKKNIKKTNEKYKKYRIIK